MGRSSSAKGGPQFMTDTDAAERRFVRMCNTILITTLLGLVAAWGGIALFVMWSCARLDS
jgi:hypothetical protein